MAKKILLLLAALLGGISHANSQSTSSATSAQPPGLLPQRVPASPTAAALERYALMPVNEAAGTPSIAVPLYEIHAGQLTVPLNLSYHASGIRVSDVASWVGLGWVLNAGGAITRVIRGMPDEHADGFQRNYDKIPQTNSFGPLQDQHGLTSLYYLLERAATNKVDFQPDLYSYNFPGHSGCFMQDAQGTYQTLPLQPVRLDVSDSVMLATDELGTRYIFADKEHSMVLPAKGNRPHLAAWYLSRIISTDKSDTITFTYALTSRATSNSSLNQQISVVSNVGLVVPGGPPPRTPQDTYKDDGYVTSVVRTKRLSRIMFRGGQVLLTALDNRLDGVGDETLQAVTVTSRDGRDTLKHIVLYHSYFNQHTTPVAQAADVWRLRLDSLTTYLPRGGRLPAHVFAYDTTELAHRVTGARDYWGYNNGAATTLSPTGKPWLIPATTVTSYANRGPLRVGGANRTPNPLYVQAGILTQIRYPTGGRHTFTYEPNTIPETYVVPNTRTRLSLSAATPYGGFEGGGASVSQDTVFTIPYRVANVRADVNITGQDSPKDGHHTGGTITLAELNESGTRTVMSWTGTGTAPTHASTELALQAGHTYKLTAKATGAGNAGVTLSYEAAEVSYAQRNIVAGGLRVRAQRIQASPRGTATIKRYYYHTPGSTRSSGYLVNAASPLFTRQSVSRIPGEPDVACMSATSGNCPPAIYDVTYTTVSSNSLGELEGTDQAVSYTTVTVVDSATTGQVAGRTVSTYSASDESGANQKPYPPKRLASWKRGNLVEQQTYSQSEVGPPVLLTRELRDYETVDSVAIGGLAVSLDASFAGPALFTLGIEAAPFAYLNTEQFSGWQRLKRTRHYRYAANGDTTHAQVLITAYTYGNPQHQQPTLIETILPGGGRRQVRTHYVADYDVTAVGAASSAPAQALRELQRSHAWAQLVEQTTTRLLATDTVITNSSLTLSRVVAPGVVVPARQLTLPLPTPLPVRSFQPARLLGSQLQVDTRYETSVVFDRYNAQRQLTQAHLPSGQPLAYLWDAQAGQPMAKLTNAAVQQVAVTSFEPKASGRWTYDTRQGTGQPLLARAGRTGNWAYRLVNDSPISRDSVPAGQYELTCWYQGTQAPVLLDGAGTTLGVLHPTGAALGDWQAARARLRLLAMTHVQVSAPGGGAAVLVDDLSLYPVGAQLTSFTYDVLRGMSSQTGPDGRTTFYEYDGLGRLVRTRDEQGHIVSQQQYHYAGK
jgi:YD repeat-containing protein